LLGENKKNKQSIGIMSIIPKNFFVTDKLIVDDKINRYLSMGIYEYVYSELILYLVIIITIIRLLFIY